MKTVKEIKTLLETKNVKFTIKGVTNYKNELKTFQIEKGINEEYHYVKLVCKYSSELMNVDKFGPTCMWLYTYDMMGNKTTSRIRYEEITILED